MAQNDGNGVNNDGISARAALFLEINFAGPDKDKRIARVLNVSPRVARELRGGRAWDERRLIQARELWPSFWDFLYPNAESVERKLAALLFQMSRLDQKFEELLKRLS